MINKICLKTQSFLTKLKFRVRKKSYLSYNHLKDHNLYRNNEYCLKTLRDNIEQPLIFHSYWYGKIERKQLFSIKSVLVTQPNSVVWLWIDEHTWDDNLELMQKLNDMDSIKIIKYCALNEVKGTPFEDLPSSHFTQSENLPFRADAFRILILYKYGGLYFDLDIMFLRDIRSLIDWEFIYCWENQPYGNNAIIYLHREETKGQLFRIVKKTNSFQPWRIFNYANNLKNVMSYPTAFFDPLWLFDAGEGGSYPYHITNWDEFFNKRMDKDLNYQDFFKGCYAFHWHNRWSLEVVKDSCFDLFDNQFSEILNWDS